MAGLGLRRSRAASLAPDGKHVGSGASTHLACRSGPGHGTVVRPPCTRWRARSRCPQPVLASGCLCAPCRWHTGAAPARPSARTATVGWAGQPRCHRTGQRRVPCCAARRGRAAHTHGSLLLINTHPSCRPVRLAAVFMLFQQPNQEPIQVGPPNRQHPVPAAA